MLRLPVINMPRAVPIDRQRQPQDNIPQTRPEREAVKRAARNYVDLVKPVTPLSMEELRSHAEIIIREQEFDGKYLDYVAVVLNNEAWGETLAAIPYERRLLLLPKCLRVEERCPAPFDEFGLLCKQCGLCSIQDLQNEAERLGYAVLVAEGSALVMALIQTGKIDAIVGVSCLNVLERAFPYVEAAAVPGIAIPLLQDDCKNTTVDMDWIWDVIHLSSEDRTYRLDLDGLRQEVEGWFAGSALDDVLGPADSETEQIAREWLLAAGKRWRPFLTVCAYKALAGENDAPLTEDLRRIAVAVECFHKASLIHDDIEDGDANRYGKRTLHEEHGVAVALNVGDLLLGEGYRLLAECDAPPNVRAEMLRIASAGHRTLCLGQGAELSWAREPRPLTSGEVLAIFRQKTAPAFEVALRLGAVYAGADPVVTDVLRRYSEALGIAYQIRDDLDDFDAADSDDVSALRPSLPLAMAYERTTGVKQEILEASWRRLPDFNPERVRELIRDLEADERCRRLMESFKEDAIRSLADLDSPSLKGLLRRVITKIFRVELKGWCGEFEARNAAGSEVVAKAAG